MQEQSRANSAQDAETFLQDLVGHRVVVHTLGHGQWQVPHTTGFGAATLGEATFAGQIEANFSDALVINTSNVDPSGGARILIYKKAIVAIEAR